MNLVAEDAARQIYQETKAFYDDRKFALGNAACGFRILYGPPIRTAPILFIGYQPGGDAGHMVEGHHWGWPTLSDYAVQDWKLAKRMREVWSASELSRCSGLNAIFFRAPSMAAWKRVPRSLRSEMEEFCRARVQRLVVALDPRCIVFIGLGTFDRFVKPSSEALRRDGRGLVKQGQLWGTPTYGIVHLSGARIRTDHIHEIRDFFRGRNSN